MRLFLSDYKKGDNKMCYPGRTEEKKRVLAEKIAEDVADILEVNVSSVSVAIKEIYS